MSEPRGTTADRFFGWSENRLRRIDARLPRTRFGRFGVAHAVTSGADAATSLALAGSLFFELEPGAAKSKVLQYLLISLAPFLFVAPFVGPLVDRLGNRRRSVLTATALIKAITVLFMSRDLQSLWLFPEALVLLVCGKAAAVARSSLVPEIVHSDDELVRANSRMSLIAVFGGAMGLAPAAAIRYFVGNPWVLRAAAFGFVGAAAVCLRIRLRPTDDTGSDAKTLVRRERADVYSEAVRVSGLVMAVLRGVVGFVAFLSLFALRQDPLWWSGLTLGALSSGTGLGALVADRLRRRFDESKIIINAAVGIGLVTVASALQGGRIVGALVAGVVGLAGSIARLAFDAIVQRDQPVAGQGAAFGRFETRFQLAWVLGALIATGAELSRSVGFFLIAGVLLVTCVIGFIGQPALEWIARQRRSVTTGVARRVPKPRRVNQRASKAATTESVQPRHDTEQEAEVVVVTAPEAPQAAWRLPTMSTVHRRRKDRQTRNQR
jgi:MFS family permease